MKLLKNLLENKKAMQPKILDDKSIFYIFRKVIQEEFGNVGSGTFSPEYFKNGVLVIKSKSPTWSSELWLYKNTVIRKINKELGSTEVEKIKIQ